MSRQYTKVAEISKEVFERKAAGEKNREIAARYGLAKDQIKGFVKRENRKARLVAQGYTLQPKGRPRKDAASESVRKENELIQLRMTVELLRNFLSEAGRR